MSLFLYTYRVDAEKMGLVCIVALMGDPAAIKPGSSDDGALLALKRLQQVHASEGNYEAHKTDIKKDVSHAYVAATEDLEKIDVKNTSHIPLVRTNDHILRQK